MNYTEFNETFVIPTDHEKNNIKDNQMEFYEYTRYEIIRESPLRSPTEKDEAEHQKEMERIWNTFKDDEEKRNEMMDKCDLEFCAKYQFGQDKENRITKINVNTYRDEKLVKNWTIEKGATFMKVETSFFGKEKKKPCIITGFYPFESGFSDTDSEIILKISLLDNNKLAKAAPFELMPVGNSGQA